MKKNTIPACKRCGMCCRAILLCYTYEELKRAASRKSSPDAEFIISNWKRISFEEAKAINPYLGVISGKTTRPVNYFSCTRLNDDGSCGCYNERPRICRVYPLNDGAVVSKSVLMYDKCGFAGDSNDGSVDISRKG